MLANVDESIVALRMRGKYSEKVRLKKVKFTLDQGIESPQGEYRYSPTLSLTSELD
jgi:hypothetical protein